MLETGGAVGDRAAQLMAGLDWPVPFGAESPHVDALLRVISGTHQMPTASLCLGIIRRIDARRVLPDLVHILRTASKGTSGFDILRTVADFGDPAVIPHLENLAGLMRTALHRAKREREGQEQSRWMDKTMGDSSDTNWAKLRAGQYDEVSFYHLFPNAKGPNWEIKIADVNECVHKIRAVSSAGKLAESAGMA
jgi:hypothetical protein